MPDPLVDLPPLSLSHPDLSPTRTRTVVGVCAVESRLVAVCQDGTGFVLFGVNAVRDKSEWRELPPVPGTLRDYQQKGDAAGF